MKAIRFLGVSIMVLLLSTNIQAQNSNINHFFDKYQGDEHFSRVSVSSRMFELFLEVEMDDPDQQALVETVSKLEGLKMLMGKDLETAGDLFKEFSKGPASNMDELMSISDANQEMRFYISEEGGKISELVMVGFDNSEVMFMSLTGEIDLKEIAALSKKMNIEGFEKFKNLHDK